METQKIIRLLKQTGQDPIEFLSTRTFKMTMFQIESVLAAIWERFPTRDEIKKCRPDKVEKYAEPRPIKYNKYGKL